MESLKAAFDIEKRGKSALGDHPDPFGSGPFGYEEVGTGCKLTTEFRYIGKVNIDMRFGTTGPSK